MPDTPSPAAVLTVGDIHAWQERYATINEEVGIAQRRIIQLEEERKEIQTKLKAAAIFAPSVNEWFSEQVPPGEEIALTDAIMKVLKERGPNNATSREKIKARLPQVGYSEAKLVANPNYLYVAFKRLLARGQITEGAEGTYKIKE